jgi:hypothetical protein
MRRWFRRKRWGYGWTPCSWQGWLVTALFVAACTGLSLSRPHLDETTRIAAIFSLVIALFVMIAFTSGKDSDA